MVISLRLDIELRIVEIIDFNIGNAVRLRNGRNSLNVRIIDTLAIPGIKDSQLVRTTMKSSQFQGSLRYVFLDITKPMATILIEASTENATMKNGSVYQTIWFRHTSSSGFS